MTGVPPGTATIEVENVTKWFQGVVALSDVSFSLAPGITALLGPNGAGKSTLLRILCGLTPPSRGRVRVLGRPPRGDVRLYRHIGLVPQQEVTFEQMSAFDFVRARAALHEVRDPASAARDALARVELDPAMTRPLRTYSKGMRQRAKVAAALVHEPTVVFLDEPLEGLDPRQRVRMIELFRGLAAEGRTVLVSSHVLEEVQRFGSRVLVVVRGRLAAEGDYRAIRSLMDNRPHRVRLRTDRPAQLGARLLESGAVVGVQLQGPEAVVVDTAAVAVLARAVAPAARAVGARLTEVAPLDDDLESVFRYLVDAR